MKTKEQQAQEWANENFEGAASQFVAIQGFHAGYAAANRWISVDEELPKNSEEPNSYLVKNTLGNMYVVKYYRNDIFWSSTFSRLENITHWRIIE